MNELLQSNQDILNDLNISLGTTLLALASSLLSSYVIRIMYIKYGRSLNNREYFANTFILLGITTCSIIIIVKYSLALSLGLVGALSIVRFRAAIKEPEELVYLFLVIALGLAFGANQFMVGFLLLAASSSIIILFYRSLGSNAHFDNTGMVIILNGKKEEVIQFRRNELESLVEKNNFLILKETELLDNSGRIVFKASSNDNSIDLITTLEDLSQKYSLELNIVSDVSVPA